MILIDIKKKLFGVDGDMYLDLSFSIDKGEFISIRGDSGSGKTTLLRILAGLESASGKIVVDGISWLDENISIPPQRREIGFVFQDYALFPNMTVEQNLKFVRSDKRLLNHLLDITELSALRDRYPNSLSGGQKQRVAIARALMKKPKLLLMDEPLSALNMDMRLKLQEQILELHREFKTTTLMVSHDLAEIYKLSDRVVSIKSGRVVDITTPKNFLSNRLEFMGIVISIDREDNRKAVVSIGGDLVEILLDSDLSISVGDEVIVFVDNLSLRVQKHP